MEPFKQIGALAVNVLAKCEAKKAVIEQLRASGSRALISHREIVQMTKAYLEDHPELREAALAQAWQMSIEAHSERLNRALFDDDRRVWRKPRSPVT
jgi:hypothetical protein